MRILVAYYTQTGNTKKIAGAIASELESLGHEVALESVRALKLKDLTGYEVIFLGSPCHSADLAKPVKKLLEKMETSPGARPAGFVTHSTYTPEGGERERKLHEQWAGKCAGTFEQACAAKGLVWGGYFGCQGAPSKPIEIFIRRTAIKNPKEWPACSRDQEAPRRPRRSPRACHCPRVVERGRSHLRKTAAERSTELADSFCRARPETRSTSPTEKAAPGEKLR